MDNKLKKVLATIIAASMLTASMAMPALASSGVTIDGVNKAGNKITGVKVIKGDAVTANGKAVVALYDAQNNMKSVAISAEDLNSATDGVLDLDANGLEFAEGDIVKTFLWEVDANGSITAKPITGIYEGTATEDPTIETFTVTGTITAGIEGVTLVDSENEETTIAGTIDAAANTVSFADVEAGIYNIDVEYTDGYEADSIKLGDADVTNINVEGNITNLAISAKVAAPTAYAITNGTTDTNGTVELSATESIAGEEITVTATPNDGYKLNAITVNGKVITGTTFTMPAEAVTVVVTFISENIIDDVLPTSYDAASLVTITSNATQTEVDGDRTVTVLTPSAEDADETIIDTAMSAGLKDATVKTVYLAYDMKLEAGDTLMTRWTGGNWTNNQGPTTFFHVNDAGNIVYDHQTSSGSGYGTANTDTGLVAADGWYRVVMSGTRAAEGTIGSYDLSIYSIAADGTISAEAAYTKTGLGGRNTNKSVNNVHISARNGSPVIDCAYIYTDPYCTATVNVAVKDEATAISGATVTVTDGKNTYTGTTTADGAYAIPSLQAGTYTVTVECEGYKPATGTLTVAADGTNTVDVALEVETATGASVTINFVNEAGDVLSTKTLTEGLLTGYKFEIAGNYSNTLKVANKDDASLIDVYTYKSGAADIDEMEATNTIDIVYSPVGTYAAYEDFESDTNMFTMTGGPSVGEFKGNNVMKLNGGGSASATFAPVAAEAGKILNASWKFYGGWLTSGKDVVYTLKNSAGETVMSYAYNTGSCNVTALTVAGVAQTENINFNLQVSGSKQNGWESFSGNPANISVTVNADKSVTANLDKGDGTAHTFTVAAADSKLTVADIASMDVTNGCTNGDRSGGFDNFKIEKITPASSATITTADADMVPFEGDTVKISDLGTFTLADGKLTGTANYIENWTAFSSKVEEQEGHYVAIQIDVAENSTVAIDYNGKVTNAVADENGVTSLLRLAEGADTVTYTVDNDGDGEAYKAVTYTIDLSGVNKGNLDSTGATFAVDFEDKIWGKTAAELGNYTIKADADDATKFVVEGTSNYIEWKEFATDASMQEGNYIVTKMTLPETLKDTSKVTVTYKGSNEYEYTFAGNKSEDFVWRLEEGVEEFTFVVDYDGEGTKYDAVTYTVDVSGVNKGNLDSTGATFAVDYEDAIWGKTAAELGNFTIEADAEDATKFVVEGTSNYIEWKEFATDASMQEGNYIVTKMTLPEAMEDTSKVTVTYKGSNEYEYTFAGNKSEDFVWRLEDGVKEFTFVVDYDGEDTKYDAVTYTVDVSKIVKQTKSYAITTVAENGTINVAESARVGETVTFTVEADEDYAVYDPYYELNGKKEYLKADGDGVYSFTMPAGNVTVGATFVSTTAEVYKITTVAENCTVTVASSSIAGEAIEMTVTPADEHYELDTLTVMAGETPVEVTDNKFTMPESDVIITATFKLKEYTVTFDVNGDTTTTDITALETVKELPEVVEVPNKYFIGWSINGGEAVDAETVLATEITGATTITAVYADVTPSTGATFAVDFEDKIWGKTAAELGEFTIKADEADATKFAVEGASNYIEWKEFATDASLQEGNYIVTKMTLPETLEDTSKVTVTYTGSNEYEYTFAGNKSEDFVWRLEDGVEEFTFVVDYDGAGEAYSAVTYTVDISAVKKNNTITTTMDEKAGTVELKVGENTVTQAAKDEVVTIVPTLNAGYEVTAITVDGEPVEADENGVYSFVMGEDATVVIVTSAMKNYKITTNVTGDGTVTVADEEGEEVTIATMGSKLVVTPTGDENTLGITVSAVDANDEAVAVTDNEDGTYSLTVGTSDVTINVYFKGKVEYNKDGTVTANVVADTYIEKDGTTSNADVTELRTGYHKVSGSNISWANEGWGINRLALMKLDISGLSEKNRIAKAEMHMTAIGPERGHSPALGYIANKTWTDDVTGATLPDGIMNGYTQIGADSTTKDVEKALTFDVTDYVAGSDDGILSFAVVDTAAGGMTIYSSESDKAPYMTITLGKIATFDVAATADAKEKVENAVIEIKSSDKVVKKATTAEDGTVSVALVAGEYTYTVTSADYAIKTGTLTIGEDDVDTSITLDANVAKSITVSAPETGTVVAAGETIQYTAVVKDQDDRNMTVAIDWTVTLDETSEAVEGVTIENGLVTVAAGATGGAYTVTATVNGTEISDTEKLEVSTAAKVPVSIIAGANGTVAYTVNGEANEDAELLPGSEIVATATANKLYEFAGWATSEENATAGTYVSTDAVYTFKVAEAVNLIGCFKYNGIVYSENFEGATTTFSPITGGASYVTTDGAKANAKEGNIYFVGSSSGKRLTRATVDFAGTSSKNAKVSFDFRIDNPVEDNSIALVSNVQNKDNWLNNPASILQIDGVWTGTNGYIKSVNVNGVAIPGAALSGDALANEQGSIGSLTRGSTGWLRADATIDFTSKKINVTITRIATEEVLYSGMVDFVDKTAADIEQICLVGGKSYGGVSIDDIVITETEDTVREALYAMEMATVENVTKYILKSDDDSYEGVVDGEKVTFNVPAGDYTLSVEVADGYVANIENAAVKVEAAGTIANEVIVEAQKATEIVIKSPDETVLKLDNSLTFTAVVKDQFGNEMKDAELTWSIVGNPENITVANGVVTVTEGVVDNTYEVQASVEGTEASAKAEFDVVTKESATLKVVYTTTDDASGKVYEAVVFGEDDLKFEGGEETLDASYLTTQKVKGEDDMYRFYTYVSGGDEKVTLEAGENVILVKVATDGMAYYVYEDFSGTTEEVVASGWGTHGNATFSAGGAMKFKSNGSTGGAVADFGTAYASDDKAAIKFDFYMGAPNKTDANEIAVHSGNITYHSDNITWGCNGGHIFLLSQNNAGAVTINGTAMTTAIPNWGWCTISAICDFSTHTVDVVITSQDGATEYFKGTVDMADTAATGVKGLYYRGAKQSGEVGMDNLMIYKAPAAEATPEA